MRPTYSNMVVIGMNFGGTFDGETTIEFRHVYKDNEKPLNLRNNSTEVNDELLGVYTLPLSVAISLRDGLTSAIANHEFRANEENGKTGNTGNTLTKEFH